MILTQHDRNRDILTTNSTTCFASSELGRGGYLALNGIQPVAASQKPLSATPIRPLYGVIETVAGSCHGGPMSRCFPRGIPTAGGEGAQVR
jgi:hypothetical protein